MVEGRVASPFQFEPDWNRRQDLNATETRGLFVDEYLQTGHKLLNGPQVSTMSAPAGADTSRPGGVFEHRRPDGGIERDYGGGYQETRWPNGAYDIRSAHGGSGHRWPNGEIENHYTGRKARTEHYWPDGYVETTYPNGRKTHNWLDENGNPIKRHRRK